MTSTSRAGSGAIAWHRRAPGARLAGAAAAAAALLVVAGCGALSSRASQPPPADDVLRTLCDESYQTARAQFATELEVSTVENTLGLQPEQAGAVVCDGDAWLLDVDSRQVRVEMAMLFGPVDDPGAAEDFYCNTRGVRIQLPNTGFEERSFDGNPYCFSWNESDRSQGASASYVDRSTLVYLIWKLGAGREVHDPGTRLGAVFSAANDEVLAGVYEGFGGVDARGGG